MPSFTAIVPNRVNRRSIVQRYLHGAEQQTVEAVKRDLEQTMRTWKRKSRITVKVERGKHTIYRFYVDGKVWNWLDQGTRPHIIVPVRAKMLRFQKGFVAKTQVGRLASGQGGKFGPYTFRDVVLHPGTKARGWSALIVKRGQRTARQNIATALARAAGEVRRKGSR